MIISYILLLSFNSVSEFFLFLILSTSTLSTKAIDLILYLRDLYKINHCIKVTNYNQHNITFFFLLPSTLTPHFLTFIKIN
ncbi:hypothetical protein BCR36DRAFT_62289 [Piromyces finnis]|uniref:Uncharacterized protein n=1 Tax=Piromyces finnis TaxID=1754191 RepID=A0A1Y1V8K9_9FUNG|nr:hypothetical protein BCR36DRAFT_62289 [Piromyces finnis]|eukprot:ORX49963.1 hypothetical protein BCR36DRAFT_62289 [Piromyces finnis]